VSLGILIVDDHAEFRTTARALLEAEGFDVLGDVADGASAIAATARLRPDLVLLDIHLPDTDGFAVADVIAAEPAAPTVVLVSSRDVSAYRRRLADSPAAGFIAKAELSGAALSALVART
jgi:DNA-binding NarL/FixJ family response regulator